ncbi:MAG: amidohydrolase [Ruminococcaceae bacterium]|nr:amidohydrolase [Oscillospiraceae bacterium]
MSRIDFLKEAKEFENEIIKSQRYLHQNAEVGFELPKTAEYVKNKLEELGCEVVACGKCGMVTTIGKGQGKTFLLRADMDALPIKEESDIECVCETGNMHACGHDFHTAMLLGAAKLLKKHENEINGRVKLMFQPAEEILSGAKNMIENGVLENPKVCAALMLHVMAGLPLKTGTVIVANGVSAPAADYFTINIQGKGCHGSTPQQGVDSLTIGSHILIALQEINARELGVSDEATLTIGKINGGTTGNVIADKAVLEGTLRAYDEEVRGNIKKRISEITQGIAGTFRGKGSADFGNGCPPLKNNGELSEEIEGYLTVAFGEEWVFNTERMGGRTSKSGGSEDFSYISQEVPSVMLALAAGNSEEGYIYPQHHPKVRFDEKVLPIGSAILAQASFLWLENH